jgi:hypothetical protein
MNGKLQKLSPLLIRKLKCRQIVVCGEEEHICIKRERLFCACNDNRKHVFCIIHNRAAEEEVKQVELKSFFCSLPFAPSMRVCSESGILFNLFARENSLLSSDGMGRNETERLKSFLHVKSAVLLL